MSKRRTRIDKEIARVNTQILLETQAMLEEIEGLEIPAFLNEDGEIIQDTSLLLI